MSCLFQSLGFFVRVDQVTLRRQICSFLAEDNVLIKPDLKVSDLIKFQPDIPSMSLEQYVHLMSLQHTNGGAIEIRAFCILYNKNVRVVQCGARTSEKNIEFYTQEDFPWVVISWNGGHFEPVN